MKPNILIRVDASPLIGHGHVIRCLALAQMLKGEFTITFICKAIPDQLKNDIIQNGFSFEQIRTEQDFFSKISDQIVVLDGYNFDLSFQKMVKSHGSSLVCIDDVFDREFVADLIINHGIGITPENYKALPHTQFALGLDFALLRPPFLAQARKPRVIEKIQTALICFGGADANNHTCSTLAVMQSFTEIRRITVVTGTSFVHLNSLNQIIEKDERICHFHGVEGSYMLSLMLESDLAVVPSSSILYEAMTAGCIIISGIIADNQKLIYEYAVKHGVIYDAKNFGDSEMKAALISVLSNDILIKRFSVNELGNSQIRVLKIFKQLYKFQRMVLSKVTSEHEQITFRWAGNPEVRKFSISTAVITLPQHREWFEKKINDRSCIYLIAEFLGMFIGSIRFDIHENVATISYLIDPLFQGEGFGTALLSKGIAFLETYNHIQMLEGTVMKENKGSIKAFQRLGFSVKSVGMFFLFYKTIN